MKPLKAKHTAAVMAVLVGLALAWEIAALGFGSEATISELVWDLSQNTVFVFAVAFVCGHWFFPKGKCVNGRAPHRRETPAPAFLAVALSGALAAGCGLLPPINPPRPNPTPTPTPPPDWSCPLASPWCHELVPPAACSTVEQPCVHNPTQDPNHCELAPACPTEPTPPDPPEPPPATECAPVLDPGLSGPPADDELWTKAVDQTLESGFKNSVWQAVAQAKLACPSAWVGDCMAQGPSGIDRGYLLIAKELQKAGIAASQAKYSWGKIQDHLWVRRAPGSLDWNATKLFFYGNGCLITGDGAFTVHGWYTFVGSDPTPPPDPEPPPAGALRVEDVPKFDRFNDLHWLNGWFDATGLVYNGATRSWPTPAHPEGKEHVGYCDAQGFVNRLHCPAAGEGTEERLPRECIAASGKHCEQGGKPLWMGLDGAGNPMPNGVQPHPDNIFKSRCANGAAALKVCTADGAVCSKPASCS